MGNIMEKLELTAQSMYCKKIEELTPAELHYSLGKAVMGEIAGNWEASKIKHDSERRAYYFSAEFLMGRMMYNNLYCLGILEDVTKLLKRRALTSMYLRISTMPLLVTAVSADLPLVSSTVLLHRKYRLTATESVTSTVFSSSLSKTVIRLKQLITGRDLKIRGATVLKTRLLQYHSRARQLRLFLTIWLLSAVRQQTSTHFVFGRLRQ